MRDALGNPESLAAPEYATMAGRFANLATLLPRMAAEVAARDRDELMAGFIRAGAVGCRVNDRADLLADPQVRHNGSVVEVDHGALGPVRVARHPIRFSATPAVERPGPAPAGQG
jgi:crotonobetainyl-CoA:carnitine CoA-transferase CaiB-like acyl-CoA transferase